MTNSELNAVDILKNTYEIPTFSEISEKGFACPMQKVILNQLPAEGAFCNASNK